MEKNNRSSYTDQSQNYELQVTQSSRIEKSTIDKDKNYSVYSSSEKTMQLFSTKEGLDLPKEFKARLEEASAKDCIHTVMDKRLHTILEYYRDKTMLYQIIGSILTILMPILITGLESFSTTKHITGCKQSGVNLQLSRCIECNGNSNLLDANLAFQIIAYLIWFVMIVYYEVQYLRCIKYAKMMNSLLAYGLRIRGSFSDAAKIDCVQLTILTILLAFTIACTRLFRDLINNNEDIICKDGILKGNSITLNLSGNIYSDSQFIIALLLSGYFLFWAYYNLLSILANPFKIYMSIGAIYHDRFDKDIEYLAGQVNSIKQEVPINYFMEKVYITKRQSGYKWPIITISDKLLDGILIVIVFQIKRDGLYLMRNDLK